ncbi:hypothetical protein [Streptomyces sp. NBC_01760]|uniref:hypothetical protein n=1 Tax=Streptomyces sp. NBC_01760 TaxID=2975931 RepID=UPI002DD8D351|nr:hypothetical protein [Streptomyces sp. NBC_01760]WSC72126.1 hypothetical protein OG807_28670 [Streptomyces sp. NBC_01760]
MQEAQISCAADFIPYAKGAKVIFHLAKNEEKIAKAYIEVAKGVTKSYKVGGAVGKDVLETSDPYEMTANVTRDTVEAIMPFGGCVKLGRLVYEAAPPSEVPCSNLTAPGSVTAPTGAESEKKGGAYVPACKK